MVEVSELYDISIYTIAGKYVGRVVDVVINIRMGRIAKLQVKALEPENKNVGIKDIFRNGLQFSHEENEMRTFQEEVITVDFDKVRAVGDIMLIDSQDIRGQAPAPSQQAQTYYQRQNRSNNQESRNQMQ